MGTYCGLSNTDIPPIGCRIFDPTYCKLDIKCQFIKKDTEKVQVQESEKKQEREVVIISHAY
jgi:hypothetical protein